MKHHKPHKKDLRPKRKDDVGDKLHFGKPLNDKVKYKHKNYWLEEEEEEVINVKKKKKAKV